VCNYGAKSQHEVTCISCRAVNQGPVRRLLGVGLLLLAAQIGYCGVAAAASPAAPAFEESPCDVPNAANVAAGLRCGTVHVPRDYAHPESGTFALSVVIAKSARQPALRDPVIYINGGPGEPLTMYAAYQAQKPYAAQRDLILVDQRGIGRSEPDLCRDLNRRLLDESIVFLADRTQDAKARLRTTYMSCHDEAVKRGIDLADFGTPTTAEDIDQVRQALGIERWNVYGESYGTTVAMTLMALHPDTLRSVVLDSVYPPDPMPPPHRRLPGRVLRCLYAGQRVRGSDSRSGWALSGYAAAACAELADRRRAAADANARRSGADHGATIREDCQPIAVLPDILPDAADLHPADT